MVVPRRGVQSRRHRRVAAVVSARLAAKLRGAAPQAWGASALRALPSHAHQAQSPAFLATPLEAALPHHTVRPSLDCISCHTLGADRRNGLARLRGASPTEPGRRNPAFVAEDPCRVAMDSIDSSAVCPQVEATKARIAMLCTDRRARLLSSWRLLLLRCLAGQGVAEAQTSLRKGSWVGEPMQKRHR